jgi:hypothetical protein
MQTGRKFPHFFGKVANFFPQSRAKNKIERQMLPCLRAVYSFFCLLSIAAVLLFYADTFCKNLVNLKKAPFLGRSLRDY